MCAFVLDLLLDSRKPVKDDSSGAAFDIVYRSLDGADADGCGNSPFVEGVEGGGHREAFCG